MSDDKNRKQMALDRVARALVEDILDTPDAALLTEIREDGGDLALEVAHLKDVYAKALTASGKSRLAAAKAAVAKDRAIQQPARVTKLDPAEARARLEAALRRDPETRNKLTLAARKGEGLSGADVQSMLEDLEALGILPPEDEEGGGS